MAMRQSSAKTTGDSASDAQDIEKKDWQLWPFFGRTAKDPSGSESFRTVYTRASANGQAALQKAEAFRKAAGQKSLHMEHLLTGLFDTEESVAASVLRSAGLDRQRLRDTMARSRQLRVPSVRPYPSAPLDALPPISEHVGQAFDMALRLAGPSGVVVSEFLLKGFLSIESCSVVEALPLDVRERLMMWQGQVAQAPPAEPHDEKSSGATSHLRLDRSRFQPHVVAAMDHAASMAAGVPVDARLALLGVLSIAHQRSPSLSSESFHRLSELLPPGALLSADLQEALGDRPVIEELELSPALAASLVLARQHLPERDGMRGRDWIAVSLLATADPSLQSLSEVAGWPIAAIQDAWFTFLTDGQTDPLAEPWASWWRAAGVPLPSQRDVRAGYHPESVKAEDRLGVDAEVTAFARLIADPTTTPPLSIGLLGDWGSGKSFFMQMLQDRVEELTVVENDHSAPCFVQISFNAWHYSDANLWASLVGHIFDEIWKKVVPQTTPAESRRQLEEQIEEAHGALFEAEAQVDEARGILLQAEAQIEKELEKLAIRQLVAETTRDKLHQLAGEIGWSGSLGAVVEVEEALRQLSGSERRLREVLDLALRDYPVRRTLSWIALSVLAATAVAVGAAMLTPEGVLSEAAARAAALGGVVGSLVSAVAVPLSRAGKLVRGFTDSLRQTLDEYSSKLEEMREDPAARNEAAVIDRAREDLARAEVRAEAARERVIDLETRRASLDPGRRLAAFLQGRVQSDDYRSRQGILSLVRRDFERLSELTTDWRESRTPPPPGVRPVARIVLYVDDLDRCPPTVVVQALEAIHLLLALRLFVVVVAVDSRWLLRSLEVHYKDLLQAREQTGDEYRLSTPHSYLEKIFQITFALAPMNRRGFADYVDFLAEPFQNATGPKLEEPTDDAPVASARDPGNGRRRSGEADSPAGGGGSSGHTDGDGVGPGSEEAVEEGPASSEFRSGGSPRAIDPTRPIEISSTERTFLKALHPLLPTPRLAKRMVNVFRLIKAAVPTADLSAFEASDDGRHRTVLLLLAILFGRSTLALELFRLLCDIPPQDWSRATPLCTVLRELGSRSGGGTATTRGTDEWSELATLVEAVAPEITVGACMDEAARVSRYSLVTGQHSHTWIRPAKNGAP